MAVADLLELEGEEALAVGAVGGVLAARLHAGHLHVVRQRARHAPPHPSGIGASGLAASTKLAVVRHVHPELDGAREHLVPGAGSDADADAATCAAGTAPVEEVADVAGRTGAAARTAPLPRSSETALGLGEPVGSSWPPSPPIDPARWRRGAEPERSGAGLGRLAGVRVRLLVGRRRRRRRRRAGHLRRTRGSARPHEQAPRSSAASCASARPPPAAV